MQRINTSFNNIDVSICIEVKDRLIHRKEKDIYKYSNNVKLVIKHLRDIISDSRDDDLLILRKYSEHIFKKDSKEPCINISNQFKTLDELDPTLVLNKIITIKTGTIIAYHLYHLFKGKDYFTSINNLFERLDLIEEPIPLYLPLEDDLLSMTLQDNNFNDIEQLDKYHGGKYKTNCTTSSSSVSEASHKYMKLKTTPLPLKKIQPIDDLIELKEIFMNKKRLVIEIPSIVTELIYSQYIFLILNQLWVFPNVLELVVDLSKNLSIDTIDSEMSNEKLKKERPFIILLLCLINILLKNTIKTISSFAFVIPYSFTSEVNHYFNNKGIVLSSPFHLLEFLNVKISKLKTILIDFNAIDSFTFQTIISIITNNPQLNSISLKLFPTDLSSTIYLSNRQLKKFCTNQHVDICKGKDCLIDNFTFNEHEYYLCKLLKTFQFNLELLIYSLSLNPINLTELKVNFELPSVISLSEKYIEVCFAFFFKLMLFIESSMNNIQSLEVSARNLPFDSEKFLNIEHEIDRFKMSNNNILKDLVLDFRIAHVDNVHMIIPIKINRIVFGEIDNETLENFGENIHIFKDLVCLTFTWFNSSRDEMVDNMRIIVDFIKALKPVSLVSIEIIFKISILSSMIEKIIQLINNDHVQYYSFTFYRNNMTYDNHTPLSNQNIIMSNSPSKNPSFCQSPSKEQEINENELRSLTQDCYYTIRNNQIYSIIFALQILYEQKNNDLKKHSNQVIAKKINTFLNVRKKKSMQLSFI